MSISKWKTRRSLYILSSGVVGTAWLVGALPAIAQLPLESTRLLEEIGNQRLSDSPSAEETDDLSQVTSIDQLSDVKPTDWAFQALQSLVQRYGCIAGYPDGTYRGNRAMTRYEFAAGLNACLDKVLEAIGGGQGVDPEELTPIRRLQDEFKSELAALRGRVDALEARTAELEANQFSVTTKLEGQAIFAAYGVASGQRDGGQDIDRVTAFGDRIRLEFLTSFTGEDELLARLQASNIDAFSTTGTNEGNLFFSGPDNNDIVIDALKYTFAIGEKLEVAIVANAGASDDFASTVNPYFDGDGNSGALSTFGTRASILFLQEQAGAGFTYTFNDKLALSAGYYAGDASNPEDKAGLFNGAYGALAQLTLTPSDNLEIGLTYINAYNQEPGTGSRLSNFRSFSEETFGTAIPVIHNAYGVELSWLLSSKLAIGGWVGLIDSKTLSSLDGTVPRGDLESWNWAVTLAFPDLGSPGSLGGLLVGMEPRTRGVSGELRRAIRDIGGVGVDNDTSLHIEGFYQWQVSDRIAITPGLIWITNPGSNEDNDSLVIGAIRTVFAF
jgi:Carbohydrate-selective porin, OprB family/S-layer homology domain